MTVSLLLMAILVFPLPRLARRRESMVTDRREMRFDWVLALSAAGGCFLFIPFPWAIAVAVVVVGAIMVLVPKSIGTNDDDRQLRIARGVPETAQMLAALVATGSTDQVATQRAAAAAAEPLNAILRNVARRRALGASAEAAWAEAAGDPLLSSIATVMIRGSETGAGTSSELLRIAQDARDNYYTRAQAAARSAAVKAVVPLAACFLPAFFLLGVVPIVASLGSELL